MTYRTHLVAVVLVATLGQVEAADPKPPVGRDMAITAQLSADRTTVGEEVTLTESMPRGVKTTVVGFRHEVLRIGAFDEKAERVRVFSPEEYVPISPIRLEHAPKYFEGKYFHEDNVFTKPLDTFWITSWKGISFDENLVTKGRAIRFTPLIPGAYMITAVWKQQKDDRFGTVSNPVILTVLPAKK